METPTGTAISPSLMGTPDSSGLLKTGRARGPLNLWSAEAREDMFNRREAGEGWETICPDFPNRSRHAMQQQFSMMKKQKAQAEGIYVHTRRRRRKQRPEEINGWDPFLQPGNPESRKSEATGLQSTEQDTEEEDLPTDYSTDEGNGSNGSLEEVYTSNPDGMNLTPEQKRSSTTDIIRPPNQSRSMTEPVQHRNSGVVKLSTSRSSNVINTFDPTPSNSHSHEPISITNPIQTPKLPAMNPYKKRRLSPEVPSECTKTMIKGHFATDPLITSTGAIFDVNTVILCQNILQEGVERARKQTIAFDAERASIKKGFEAEKASMKGAFEAAAFRLNRRLQDMQDICRDATREHAEKIHEKEKEMANRLTHLRNDRKQWEREQAGILRTKEIALAETLAKLDGDRRQLEQDNKLYLEENRRLNSQLVTLEDTSNALENLEGKKKQLEQEHIASLDEIQRLRMQLQSTEKDCSTSQHLERVQKDLSKAVTHAMSSANRLAERDKERDGYRKLLNRIGKQVKLCVEKSSVAQEEMKDFAKQYQDLTGKIKVLEDDWDKLPYKDLNSRFMAINIEADKLIIPLDTAERSANTVFDIPRLISTWTENYHKDDDTHPNGTGKSNEQKPEASKIEREDL